MSAVYPPPVHFLRDLGIDLESMLGGEGQLDLEWQVSEDLCDGGGRLRCGLLAPVIDIVAGRMSGQVVAPDWLATSDLNLHLLHRAPPGPARLRGRVLRVGQNRVVSEVEVETAEGTPVATSRVAYARLRGGLRSQGPSGGDGARVTEQAHGGSLFDRIGLDTSSEEPGRVVLTLHDYIRNSLGGLQGGLTALLIEAAALHLARFRPEVSFCSDLSLHYLNVGRVGPFATSAAMLREVRSAAMVESRIHDSGLEDRVVAVGTVQVASPTLGFP